MEAAYAASIGFMEGNMRLDKYLKVARLIKRRTVANEACDTQRVVVNGREAKASYQVKVGDIIMQVVDDGVPFMDPIELQDPRVHQWREILRQRYTFNNKKT